MSLYKFLPDDVLLRLIKKSDELAFRVIYDRYWEHLFAVAYQRLQDVPASEDVVHEVFLSLWKHRGSRDIRAVRSYLSSAVKFQTISLIRKKIRESVVQNDEDVRHLEIADTGSDPSDLMHARYLMDRLQDRLRELPPKCQLIFRYSRFEHLRNEQIAEKLSLSKRTVENQLSRALSHLKPLFKD